MNKIEYGDLLADIGGGRDIGIAARRERTLAEQLAISTHAEELWSLLCLGDAVHQFYRDSLEMVRQEVLTTALDDVQTAMVNWHIVSFERFAVAFDLMARAYYFEAMALARDLWEIALSLAALKRNTVSLNELVAADAKDRLEMESASRAADSKIRRALLWENPALDTDAREALETFLGLVNLATHKSKLHWAQNLRDLLREGSISIFPRVDHRQAGVAQNILYLASWSLISTLPYLEFALRKDDPVWMLRYSKVQLAFREGVAAGPNPTVRAWPSILRHVFAVES